MAIVATRIAARSVGRDCGARSQRHAVVPSEAGGRKQSRPSMTDRMISPSPPVRTPPDRFRRDPANRPSLPHALLGRCTIRAPATRPPAEAEPRGRCRGRVRAHRDSARAGAPAPPARVVHPSGQAPAPRQTKLRQLAEEHRTQAAPSWRGACTRACETALSDADDDGSRRAAVSRCPSVGSIGLFRPSRQHIPRTQERSLGGWVFGLHKPPPWLLQWKITHKPE